LGAEAALGSVGGGSTDGVGGGVFDGFLEFEAAQVPGRVMSGLLVRSVKV
jgi:hypothetical protein